MAQTLSSDERLLEEEMAEFYDDPLGFVQACFPWGEGPLANEQGPDANQVEFLGSLGEEVRKRDFDNQNPVLPILMAESSGHGTGKGLGLSSIITTPCGMMKWGDLAVQDIVFGGDGSPARVIARHDLGVRPIYRVNFDDGSACEVTSDHLWNVRGRRERRNKLEGWRTLSTEDILELGVTRPNGVARARQWEIPIQGPAQFEEREIDLHPYFVGLWLGDGFKGQPAYHKPFPELVERLRCFGMTVSEATDGGTKRILGVMHLFRDCVFQCGSHERYIPEDYKFNTIENRRELLRGLLDSDGECGPRRGSIGYSSTSKRLAEDVMWLVRSLGGKASLQPTIKEGWYPDAEGNRVECRDCYRVTIQLDWNPFTVEHRKKNFRPCERRYLVRWIDSIEYSHDEEAMCITVDRADGLYLANDFIVTHNSAMGAWLTWWILSTRPGSIGTVTAGTYVQLEGRTWAAIQWWGKLCVTAHWFDIQAHGIYSKVDPANWKALAQSCKEENAQSFAGQHARGSTSWYLFDEASEVPNEVWKVATGGLIGGEPMFFAWGQCVKNTGAFYEICFGSQAARWNHRRVDSRTSRFTNKELIAQWAADYGIESDYFRVRVLGMPPSASELQYIDRARVDAARKRVVAGLLQDPLVAGFDVSGGGKAWNVIRFRQGLNMNVLPPIRIPGEHDPDRSMRIALCAELLSDQRAGRQLSALFIDTAFGAPIAATLKSMGFDRVFEVAFGSDSPDFHFVNLRAYMYGKLKDALLQAALPPDDEELAQQLCLPGYHIRTGGSKLVIESKADIQKRGEKSPDDADALALTFAMPVAPVMPQQQSYRPHSIRGQGGWQAF